MLLVKWWYFYMYKFSGSGWGLELELELELELRAASCQLRSLQRVSTVSFSSFQLEPLE
jgi:hypothetical protein